MTQPTRFISRYEIQRRLGHGGMGVLYLARDPHIDRLVAVKLLHGEFADDELRRRFVLEAKASGGLSHPNIVTVHDFGEYEGAPFIVMEYVRGDTLATLIQRASPISLVQKLDWMEQVCAGLSHAHGMGIIHRDIKPSNLMVDQHGRMKILDFGIARLTGTGPVMMSMVVGTPGYMSPEQIQGGMIDVRSDVFALGAVLYEILSFRPAFPGENPATIMHRVLSMDPAPLSPQLGEHDHAITDIVNTALAKNAADRYPNMEAFRAAIARSRVTIEALSSAPTRMTPLPKTAITVLGPRPRTELPPAPVAPVQAPTLPTLPAIPAATPVVPAPAPSSPSYSAPAAPATVPSAPVSAAPVSAAPVPAALGTPAPVVSAAGEAMPATPAAAPPWASPSAAVSLGAIPQPIERAPASRGVSLRPLALAAVIVIPLIAIGWFVTRLPSSGGSGLIGLSGGSELPSTTRPPAFVPLMTAVPMSAPGQPAEESPEAEEEVSTLAARAASAEAAGNLGAAFVQYTAVLRVDPENVEAQRGIARIRAERRNTADRLVRRANTRFEAADYDGAVGDLNRALEADPGHREAAALLEKVRLARAAEGRRRQPPQG